MQSVNYSIFMIHERSVNGLLLSGGLRSRRPHRFFDPGSKPDKVDANAERFWKYHAFLSAPGSGAGQRMQVSGEGDSSLRT